MKPLALIQLVSDQTMQNLLPVLAFRPRALFHLTTPITAKRSNSIVEGARQAGLSLALENIQLSETPSIEETSRAVTRAVRMASEKGLTPVVNFTGGTKLMSIGAYEAAKTNSVFSLYVETHREQFLDGKTNSETIASLLGNNLTFDPLKEILTVEITAAANGRPNISKGRDWEPYIPLSQYFLDYETEEKATWNAIWGTNNPNRLLVNGREPKTPADWLRLLDTPISLPPEVGRLAAHADLLTEREGCWYLPQDPKAELAKLAQEGEHHDRQRYFETVAPLQFALGFLTGGWWEVAVVDAAARSGYFRDLRWSIHVGRQNETYSMEEDIVGMDGVQIAYFSCKRGGDKSRLVPHLDELANRAQTIGGLYTRRFLCVCYPPQKAHFEQLEKRAEELRTIHILTRKDLKNPECFKKKR